MLVITLLSASVLDFDAKKITPQITPISRWQGLCNLAKSFKDRCAKLPETVAPWKNHILHGAMFLTAAGGSYALWYMNHEDTSYPSLETTLTSGASQYGLALAGTVLSKNTLTSMTAGLLMFITKIKPVDSCVVNTLAPLFAEPNKTFKYFIDTNKIFKDKPDALLIREVGQTSLPSWLQVTDVLGSSSSVAYLGTVSGLKTISVSDPANPSLLGNAAVGIVNGLSLSGTRLLLACSTQPFFKIVDIKDPSNPIVLGNYTTGTTKFVDVDVWDSTALIAVANTSLLILDISNPSTPSLLSKFDGSGGCFQWPSVLTRVAVFGTYAVINNYYTQYLNLVDFTDTTKPFCTKTQTYGCSPYGVCWFGGNTNIISGGITNLIFQGSGIILATTDQGLSMVETTSNPSYIVFTGNYVRGKRSHSVVWVGTTAFIAAEDGLVIVDTTNVKTPTLISNYTANRNSLAIATDGATAFVGTITGLDIFDVRNTSKPVLLSSFSTPSIQDLAVSQATGFTGYLQGTPTGMTNGTTYNLEIVGKNCTCPFTLTVQPPISTAPPPPVQRTAVPMPEPRLMPLGNNTQTFQQLLNQFFSSLQQESLRFSATLSNGKSLPSWLQLIVNGTQYSLVGQYTTNEAGNYYVRIVATDFTGRNSSDTILFRVEGPPRLNGLIPPQYAYVDKDYNYFLPQDLFTDPNLDPLVYSFVANNKNTLPGWLRFNPASLTFMGTPKLTDVGVSSVFISANDNIVGTASTMFDIRVDNPPKVNRAIPDQVTRMSKLYTFIMDPRTFRDEDNDPLTISNATLLPNWLILDTNNGVVKLSGTPNDQSIGRYVIGLKAQDPYKGEAIAEFTLDVLSNRAPDVISIPNVPGATVFKNYETFLDMTQIFKDSTNDSLVFDLTANGRQGLPDWLSFKPTSIVSTYKLSGKPGREALNFYSDKIESLILSATDDLGARSTANLNMLVTGESYGKLLLKIAGPTISGLGTVYAVYKNRALLLNKWRRFRRSFIKPEVVLSELTPSKELETNLENKATTVRAYQELDQIPPAYKFWAKHYKPLPGGVALPAWLAFDPETNTLAIKKSKLPEQTAGPVIIRVKNKKGVIKEEFPLRVEMEGIIGEELEDGYEEEEEDNTEL